MSVIDVEGIHTRFGTAVIHENVSFSIAKGSLVALIGGSGCGKSTLLREIIGLLRPTQGRIRLLGEDLWSLSEKKLQQLRSRIGVLFQYSALFSSLTVSENISVPLEEQGVKLEKNFRDALVRLHLDQVRLSADTCQKMPNELSGGMRKRVGLARALVLEPEVLFLDEPTSGLDPISARAFDDLILTLCRSLDLTVLMVTHDLDSLANCDRVIVLGERRVLADGTPREVEKVDHPWIREYFQSRRIVKSGQQD